MATALFDDVINDVRLIGIQSAICSGGTTRGKFKAGAEANIQAEKVKVKGSESQAKAQAALAKAEGDSQARAKARKEAEAKAEAERGSHGREGVSEEEKEVAAVKIQGQARRVHAASRVEDIRASKAESAVEAQGNGLLLMHRFPVFPSFFIFFFVTVVVILSFVVSSNSCPLYENCNFFFFLQFQRCQKVYRKFFVITQILKSKS